MLKKLLFVLLLHTTGFAQTLDWGLHMPSRFEINREHGSATYANGDFIIGGHYKYTGQITSNAPTYTTQPGKQHGYLARYDSLGNFIWWKDLAGNDVRVQSVQIDDFDTLFISGSFTDTIYPDETDSNIFYYTSSAYPQFFMAKYLPGGQFDKMIVLEINNASGAPADHRRKNQLALNGANQVLWIIDLSSFTAYDLDPSIGVNRVFSNNQNSSALISYNRNLEYIWHRELKMNSSASRFSTIVTAFHDLRPGFGGDIYITGDATGSMNVVPGPVGFEVSISGSGNVRNGYWLCLSKQGNFKWSINFKDGFKPKIGWDIESKHGYVMMIARGDVNLSRTMGATQVSTTGRAVSLVVARFSHTGNLDWVHELDSGIHAWDAQVLNDNLFYFGSYRNVVDFDPTAHDTILNGGIYTTAYMSSFDTLGDLHLLMSLEQKPFTSIFHTIIPDENHAQVRLIADSGGPTDFDNNPNSSFTLPLFNNLISYKLPKKSACRPPAFLDTLSAFYTYCAQEPIELNFERNAHHLSILSWQIDTGTGFLPLSNSAYTFQNNGYRLLFTNYTHTDTAHIRGIVSNTCGVDTSVSHTLYIYKEKFQQQSFSLCATDTVVYNGIAYTTPIVFFDTLQNWKGCDSIVQTSIDYVPPVITVSDDQGILKVKHISDYTYQWIDCLTGDAILDATDTVFTPPQAGSYAVVISKNTCVDTSDCIASNIGLNETPVETISIFPNPAHEYVTLYIPGFKPLDQWQAKLLDVQGKTLFETPLEKPRTNLPLSELSSGIYFLEVEYKQQVVLRRKILVRH